MIKSGISKKDCHLIEHIIFSSNSSWSIYNFRKNLLIHLKNLGYSVSVVAPKGEYLDKLQNLGFQICPINLDSGSTGIMDNIKVFHQYYSIYKKIKPDVILHNAVKPNIYGTLICRLLKIPVVNNISGLGTIFLSNNISSKVGKLLYRISQKKVNTIFFQNPIDRSLFIEKKLVQQEQTQLLPGSGVDLQRYKPFNFKRADNITRFCYVGRLLRDKGIYELIDAIREIKLKYVNCKFYVLGELYEQNPTAIKRTQLDDWIEQELITFLGKTDSIEKELYKFDCIILPSYREGLSRVLLEASAMAIPCITTDVPGCRDVIDHGKNGFICNVKNSYDLAQKIENFIDLPSQVREEMGIYGRKKVENQFDEKIVIKKYVEVIQSIIKTQTH